MPTLFLIDGSSQMYRAYHAIRGLTGPDGRSTNAVYGFVAMLRKLLADHKPDAIGAAFDLEGRTFRDDLSAHYKANRAPMPPDLVEQVPLIHEACAALGVPVLTSEGFEADDVIGTLALKAAAEGYDVAIVTGDKDFFQLVGGRIRVFNPRDEGTWYDPAGVVEKFGVAPDRVVDVLALTGDAVDNVKGVPGIGDKGARDLIAQFGSLDALLEGAAGVQQKRYREALLANADAARASRELVTIRPDVPVDRDLDSLRYRGPDQAACYALFTKLGFRTFTSDFAPTAATVATDYAIVDSLEGLAAEVDLARSAGRVGLRVLGDDGNAMRAGIVGIAFSRGERHARYVPLGHRALDEVTNLDTGAALRALASLLEDEQVEKVGHDVKYDAIVLARHGVTVAGPGFDTMLASYLLDSTRAPHALETLSIEHLDYKPLTEEAVYGKGAKASAPADMPATATLAYAAERADLPLQLARVLRARLTGEGLASVYEELEWPLVPVLAALEQVGVRVDTAALDSLSRTLEREMQARSSRVFELAGESFNINSPKQLGEILFEKLKLPVLKKTGTTRVASTSVDVLEELALTHELPRLILEWRTMQKLKGTYVDALPGLVNPATGRVHTSFNQAVAATGRLSSSDPNLQNIPVRTELGREIRRAFVAEPGCVLISADYSQIELRVLAHLAGDEALIEAFRRGEDIHDRTALAIFGADERARQEGDADAREDGELRAALRQDRVFAVEGHRRDAAGGAGLHRRLFRRVPRRAAVHRPDARGRPRVRHGEDPGRAPPARAGADEQERPGAERHRARGGEHAHPGHRRRHPEARDDRRPPRPRGQARPRERHPRPHDPDRARRTALRGSQGGSRRGGRPGEAAHGGRRRARGAADRRCGHRGELEGREKS